MNEGISITKHSKNKIKWMLKLINLKTKQRIKQKIKRNSKYQVFKFSIIIWIFNFFNSLQTILIHKIDSTKDMMKSNPNEKY